MDETKTVETAMLSTSYSDGSETEDYVFHPSNLNNPISIERSTYYNNGNSINEKIWYEGWTRNIQRIDYTDDGRRISASFYADSDMSPAFVTNSISVYDFSGLLQESFTPLSTATYTYDDARRLTSVTTTFTDGNLQTTEYLYNEIGEQIGATQDGITSFADSYYYRDTIDNEIWHVNHNIITTAHNGNVITGSHSRASTQITGLSVSLLQHSINISANDKITVFKKSFDPATKIMTDTTQTDNETPVIQKSMFGAVVETESRSMLVRHLVDATMTAHDTAISGGGRNTTRKMLWNADLATWDHLAYRWRENNVEMFEYFDYDAWGNVITHEDMLGNVVWTDYDIHGRPIYRGGASYPELRAYDAAGRLTSLSTTRNGTTPDTTRWNYDHVTGLVISKIYADGSSVNYTHTSAGQPLRTTSARGAWKENAYDTQNRLAATAFSSPDTPSVEYSYGLFNTVTNVSESTGLSHAYAYNARMSLTNETVSSSNLVFSISRDLGEHDQVSAVSLKINNVKKHATSYAYNNDNDLVEQTFTNAQNRVLHIAYTNRAGFALGYAITTPAGNTFKRDIVRHSYRPELIASCSHEYNGAPITAYAYTYDRLSKVTRKNTNSGAEINDYTYNTRSEVTGVSSIVADSHSYAYDYIGNRQTARTNNVLATSYAANQLNQYSTIATSEGATAPTYDADGNMLANGVWAYTYDAKNRLKTVSSNSVLLVANEYDYQHRRIRKTTPDSVHTYIYDGWNLIHEIVTPISGDSATEIQYFWGTDLSGTLQGAGGVGGLIAVSVNGQFYFTCYDNNGNITAYVSESGAVTAEYVYDAFGNATAQSGAMASAFPHRFSTKYYDPETEFYYFGYRFYSAEIGRWLNRDPIEERGGINLYSFVSNNSIKKTDRLGLKVLVIDVEAKMVAGDERFSDVSQTTLEYSFSVIDGLLVKMEKVSEKMFNDAKTKGKIKFNNKAFTGSRQEYIDIMKREKESK